LARLWAEQGERQKAYDLLAPVYGWFTEGFDTADPEDAEALLGELPLRMSALAIGRRPAPAPRTAAVGRSPVIRAAHVRFPRFRRLHPQ
jgi:hypothetical protein